MDFFGLASSLGSAVSNVVTNPMFQSGLSLTLTAADAYMKYSAAEKASARMEQAASQQERLNTLNERALQAENAERERRMKQTQQQQESLARAKAGASGMRISEGGTADYLSFLQKENLQQYDWLVKSGKSNLDIMKKSGASAVAQTRSQAKAFEHDALSSAVSGFGNIFNRGMDMGGWTGSNAWWR